MKAIFKVQLSRKSGEDSIGTKVAIQRLIITTNKESLFANLNEKIARQFKELSPSNITFDLFWKDDSNDYIRIHNNDSLVDAMDEMGCSVFTLYASITTDNAEGEKILVFCFNFTFINNNHNSNTII